MRSCACNGALLYLDSGVCNRLVILACATRIDEQQEEIAVLPLTINWVLVIGWRLG